MLTCYIDFKSAAAYLALKPTLVLAERLDLQIDWRPFQNVERDVPKLGQHETVGESHRRVRAASQRALAMKYAAHQGIDLKYPDEIGATDLALGILAEIEGDPMAFIHGAFDAYWSRHLDLDNPDVAAQILRESGAHHSGDVSSARATLAAAQLQAEAAGIVGTPAYVIQDQIFVGREHLPWIAEIARAEGTEPA